MTKISMTKVVRLFQWNVDSRRFRCEAKWLLIKNMTLIFLSAIVYLILTHFLFDREYFAYSPVSFLSLIKSMQ